MTLQQIKIGMPKLNNYNNIIIYHLEKEDVDCPDGIMSAAIVALYLSENKINYKIQGDAYRNIQDYEDKPPFEKYPFVFGDILWIVDYSFPQHWLRYWENKGVIVKVYEHHEKKFGWLSDFSNAVLDKHKCGATLVWSHLFPDKPLPEILIHVERRDIGKDGYYENKVRDSEAINEGLGELRYFYPDLNSRIFALASVLLNNNPDIKQFQEWGEPILIERDILIKEALKRVKIRQLLNYEVPYLLLTEKESRYYSMIANKMLDVYSNYLFSWVELSNNKHSLRSKGFDTQPIAKAFGGDGHPSASSFFHKFYSKETAINELES